jgi:flavodoxin
MKTKTAVIYYSYEGNSVLVAETIKEALGAKNPNTVELFRIKTVDAKKRSGFAKYAWGGGQVFMHKKPALRPLSVDINACDLIILGTPVWAWSPAPALSSFLSDNKITGKKIALFCCHGGGKGKTFEKIRAMVPGNTIVAEIDFFEPARMNSAELKQKIEDWVKTLGV